MNFRAVRSNSHLMYDCDEVVRRCRRMSADIHNVLVPMTNRTPGADEVGYRFFFGDISEEVSCMMDPQPQLFSIIRPTMFFEATEFIRL